MFTDFITAALNEARYEILLEDNSNYGEIPIYAPRCTMQMRL